jgi:uncharacterized phage protein (TIGR02220 family)
MSFEAIQWALNQPLKPLHSRLLIELCSHLNATTKQCNPSISRLEKRLLCSRPSITAALLELERLGAITKSKAINQSTTYIIHTENQLSNFTSKEFLLVKNLYSGSKKSLPPLVKNLYSGSKKSLLKTVSKTVSKTVKETLNEFCSPEAHDVLSNDQHLTPEYFDKPSYSIDDNSPDAVAFRVVEYLNETTGRRFKQGEAHSKLIRARIKQDKADEYLLKRVIDYKVSEWTSDKMKKFLRPQTLFAKDNYLKYLDEIDLKQQEHNDMQQLIEDMKDPNWINPIEAMRRKYAAQEDNRESQH